MKPAHEPTEAHALRCVACAREFGRRDERARVLAEIDRCAPLLCVDGGTPEARGAAKALGALRGAIAAAEKEATRG